MIGPDIVIETDRLAVAIELALAPDELPALLRHATLRQPGARRPAVRGSKLNLIWHDTPEGALAKDGISLTQRQTAAGMAWVRERMVPDAAFMAPPGLPPRHIETSEAFPEMNDPLLPVAAFDGTTRDITRPTSKIRVTLLQGELRAVTATREVCRLLVTGPGAFELALTWAATLRIGVAPQSLAAEAHILARRVPPARLLGAPALRPRQSAGDGFAYVVAHLAGVIQHHAALIGDGSAPEPVHQMRVALRRLRSATLLFRRAVACPALADVNERLKLLGRVLGPPRDWDVFTRETGCDAGLAFPDDMAVAALLAGAERQRVAGYAALARYLDSAAWRELGVALAHLATSRSWVDFTPADPAEAERHTALQQSDISAFAARALSKRLDDVIAPGSDLSGLDIAALHDIRLHGKRLRYAAEFFAPLFPGGTTRRFLRRMTALQEHLGHINDGAVAASLMSELPGRGTAHHYAIGVIRGFVAARAGGGRRKFVRIWQRFLKQDLFWDER